MKVRGRVWLGFWLLVFLATAFAVVARQRSAITTAATLRSLRNERLALEARRAEYETRIREASSRATLVPKAKARLDLREPTDSEAILLTLPRRADTTR